MPLAEPPQRLANRGRAFGPVWLWVAISGGLGLSPPAVSPAVVHSLISDRVDGVHEDFATTLAPVQVGPFTVRLRSNRHTLEVLEHELRLEPRVEGGDLATLYARYRGRAELVAELDLGGPTTRLEDEVEVPLQESEIVGRIELAREGEDYRVTTVELPAQVEIEVRSGLGGRLELLCRGVAVMALGSLDCDALGRSLSQLRLPLPPAGRSYLIEASRLTDAERRQVDDYLDRR